MPTERSKTENGNLCKLRLVDRKKIRTAAGRCNRAYEVIDVNSVE